MPLEGTYKKKKVESLTLFSQEDKEEAEKKDFLEPEDISIEIELKAPEEKELYVEKDISDSEFPKKLQTLIKRYGSSLSLSLCEHLIKELKNTLDRKLTIEDVETAAKIFVNQENL